MEHLGIEEGSIVRINASQEVGTVVSTVQDWCSVSTRSGLHTVPHEAVRYLGTPGVDCPYWDDFL